MIVMATRLNFITHNGWFFKYIRKYDDAGRTKSDFWKLMDRLHEFIS